MPSLALGSFQICGDAIMYRALNKLERFQHSAFVKVSNYSARLVADKEVDSIMLSPK